MNGLLGSPTARRFALTLVHFFLLINAAHSQANSRSKVELIPQIEHVGGVESTALSPDGMHLASAGYDGTLKLWNVITGRLVKSITQRSKVGRVAFSPNGRRLL